MGAFTKERSEQEVMMIGTAVRDVHRKMVLLGGSGDALPFLG